MKRICIFLLFFGCLFGVYGQQGKLKISSFNVRNDNQSDAKAGNGWQNRYPVIASMILFHDLDIIGTQECKNNQVIDLDSILSDYSYIGRGRGKGETDDEYVAIFYKTDKFALLDNGDFWLSESPEEPSKGWDAALNRICSWGKFEDRETGFQFFVFNLHLDHVGVKAQKNSAILVLQKIREIAPDFPVILTGDFNVDQHSDGYQIITLSELLQDSYVLSPIIYNSNGTFNAFDINNTTNQRIDHIFITRHFVPTRYGILTDIYWTDKKSKPFQTSDFPVETGFTKGIPRLPSDHFPVVVELKIVNP